MKVLSLIILIFSVSSFSQTQGQIPSVDSTILGEGEMPYQDGEFACFDSTTAARYTKDFNIDVKSFGGSELCNAQVDFKKLMNDLYIIENGRFNLFGREGETFIKGFVAADQYYSWMKSQTYGVERGNDIPYATAYNSGGYFTMQDGWAKLSTLGRVGTVVHEARHTAGYRHIVCRQGPYQDSSVSGCDRDYNYGGSHAVEMEYYARVSVLGQNFHPVYKKMARLMAIGRSNIFFNTPVIQKKESLLVLSEDRSKSYLLDDSGGTPAWVEREVPQVPGDLKTTSFGAVIFDGVRAFAIDPYQNSGFADLVTDTYSYFKLLLDKNLNSKDLIEYDLGSKRYVTKITNDNKIANFVFPQGDWASDMQIPFEVKTTTSAFRGSDQLTTQGLFIVGVDNSISVFQPATSRLQVLQNRQWDTGVKRFINFAGTTVELMTDGQLKSSSKDFVFPDAKASDIAKIPLYNGFVINKDSRHLE
jgi:hypothetical protein